MADRRENLRSDLQLCIATTGVRFDLVTRERPSCDPSPVSSISLKQQEKINWSYVIAYIHF